MPLKATRSVGLQVKLSTSTEKMVPNTPKRPNAFTTTNTTPINNSQSQIDKSNPLKAGRLINKGGSTPITEVREYPRNS